MRKDSFLLKGFFLDKLEPVIQINYLKNDHKDIILSDYYFILNNFSNNHDYLLSITKMQTSVF